MKPAYHIALTAAEKRLIAELGALQSQIEWLMQITVVHLLEVSIETARVIMGSTSIATNALIWISVVRERHQSEDARAWAEHCYSSMAALARSRNDFMHTLFGFGEDASPSEGVFFAFGHLPVAAKGSRRAIRVKSGADVQLDQLKAARDAAVKLSIAMAHVEWLAMPVPDEPSPWLRRLGSRLPPQTGTAGPRKAKGRRSPPRPKRG